MDNRGIFESSKPDGTLEEDAVFVLKDNILKHKPLEGDLWNIDTLSDFIGEKLHESEKLDLAQAQKRKGPLKKISSSIIKRISTITGGIAILGTIAATST